MQRLYLSTMHDNYMIPVIGYVTSLWTLMSVSWTVGRSISVCQDFFYGKGSYTSMLITEHLLTTLLTTCWYHQNKTVKLWNILSTHSHCIQPEYLVINSIKTKLQIYNSLRVVAPSQLCTCFWIGLDWLIEKSGQILPNLGLQSL